jgi:rhamnosyltransferase
VDKQVTIILLTKNGAIHLDATLQSIFSQGPCYEFEVLVIDSGSTDATLEIVRQYPVRLVEIPADAFQHGRTRNLAGSLASPSVEYLVYLTQDATPLPDWLHTLVDAVAADDGVAGSFSRHIPRPDCNPLVARRIMEEWPQVGGQQRVVKQLTGSLAAIQQWHELAHFSNTSSCVRKIVWQRLPFPEVDFAEDVAWAVQALKAGYKLVYEPTSRVVHSHSGSLSRQFRENVDHGRGVRLALGDRSHRLMSPRHSAYERVRQDIGYILTSKRSVLERIGYMFYMPLWYLASTSGQWVGARIDGWPRWLRERLSWQSAVERGR